MPDEGAAVALLFTNGVMPDMAGHRSLAAY
jgi:hypothetical protein